ncbi:hypothetical protein U0070_017501 [Myodes glareolus]|uniref:Mitotic spindle assembly checkpoint protein MAD1 n=1 Tax=Myodes glareolus TaxID=447135 RepID=A0AAW0HWQ8_MYOGA
MEDLGENTTVLSTLRSLNSFISQRVEGGSGLDVSTSAPGSLQLQYEKNMQLEERAQQIRSKSYLIQVEREKMQMELSHKRARVELERAANTSARNYEREVDRNQELLARIRQLQEREAAAEEKMREQLECHRLCKQNLDATSQQLRELEDDLAAARERISSLKARVSELQLSAMDQKVQVKRLESEKQELKEQLDLQQRKCQEANQKIQELQASQEERTDQEQKIKDLEQKLCLQEQDAAVVKSMKSELLRLPKIERELKRLREENTHLREMKETNGLLTEELEGLQRKLGRQEKMQEALVDLELEKEKLLAKLQSWEKLDQTMGLNLRWVCCRYLHPGLLTSSAVSCFLAQSPQRIGQAGSLVCCGEELLFRLNGALYGREAEPHCGLLRICISIERAVALHWPTCFQDPVYIRKQPLWGKIISFR